MHVTWEIDLSKGKNLIFLFQAGRIQCVCVRIVHSKNMRNQHLFVYWETEYTQVFMLTLIIGCVSVLSKSISHIAMR